MAGLMAEVSWKVLERRARTKRSDSSVLILFGLTGAWWAAIYGVTQSRTRLKRLCSSSSASGTRTCVVQ